MIILIAGTSHTGKTYLSQKLSAFEFFEIQI